MHSSILRIAPRASIYGINLLSASGGALSNRSALPASLDSEPSDSFPRAGAQSRRTPVPPECIMSQPQSRAVPREDHALRDCRRRKLCRAWLARRLDLTKRSTTLSEARSGKPNWQFRINGIIRTICAAIRRRLRPVYPHVSFAPHHLQRGEKREANRVADKHPSYDLPMTECEGVNDLWSPEINSIPVPNRRAGCNPLPDPGAAQSANA